MIIINVSDEKKKFLLERWETRSHIRHFLKLVIFISLSSEFKAHGKTEYYE